MSADGSPASTNAVTKRGPRRLRSAEDDAPRVSFRDTLRQRRHHAAARTRHAMPHVWPVTKATMAQAWGDRIFGLAAEAGFWALLSMTPLLLVLVGAVGYLTPLFGSRIVVEVEQKILRAAGHFLAPQAVHNLLQPVLTDVLQHGRGGIISISFVLALWTGSTAMNTYVNTISISYGMRHIRSAVRARVVAFVLYLGALVAGAVALPLLVTAPEWIVHLVPHPIWVMVRPIVDVLYWPVIVAVCTGVLATLYHVATPVREKWRRELPGAIAGMLIWLASSFGLRAYLSYAIGHSPTYGALSAPVAALLFLYFTALAVLLGAELNAQIAGCRHDQPQADQPRLALPYAGPMADPAAVPSADDAALPTAGDAAPLATGRSRKVTYRQAALILAERDPVVARLIAEIGLPRFPAPTEANFATLVRSVTYQQLAGASARAIHGRLIAALGEEVTPERLLATPAPVLRATGLSTRKVESLQDLAAKVLDGTVVLDARRLARVSDEEIVARLSTVRGIGKWSAEIFLMFQLRRMDVWPTGDLAIRKGYGLAWGIPTPTPRQLDVLGEPYRPYRTVLAWYCWRAAHLYGASAASAVTA